MAEIKNKQTELVALKIAKLIIRDGNNTRASRKFTRVTTGSKQCEAAALRSRVFEIVSQFKNKI